MSLGHKRQAFIEAYLQCFNAAEAARRAGYSEKTARQQGSRLLSNVDVQKEISRRLDERAMQANEVIDRLTSQARGDMGDFMDIDSVGYRINLKKAKDKGLTHLIKKVKERTVITSNRAGDETETHHIEVELYDAHAANQDLGKIRGLFVDRSVADVNLILPDAIKEALDVGYGKKKEQQDDG